LEASEGQVAEHTDVAIVGAGPAGLAVGACLRNAGFDFIILERNREVGSSWRRHYDRLHLHTVKQLSSLPYVSFPAAYPRYVPRNLVIEYLETYAATFALKPRFGDAVRSIRREGDDWAIEGASSSISATHVVIASGFNAEPVMPAIPGMEAFGGKILHSADYVNARPFAGQSVLVVGMGNTGAELALDLCENGARTTISLRNGVHIAPRDLFGVPIQVAATLASKVFPVSVNDAIFPFILDFALGYPSKHGLRRPKEGILLQIARSAKIPVLDVGTVQKIAEGAIKITPGISTILADGVLFEGGQQGRFDTIIFATGYRPNYRNFLEADSRPGGQSADPTMHFVGFKNPVTGLLREISREALQVADAIRRGRMTPRAR
jgi:cation diffusion facilitator CzcD-associated flavoprotein CzcO